MTIREEKHKSLQKKYLTIDMCRKYVGQPSQPNKDEYRKPNNVILSK